MDDPRDSSSPSVLPTFFLVGAERSGTTWIHQRLVEHDDVFVPLNRSEIHFFDRNYHQGLAYYERFYRGWNGERAVGDLTPSYMNDPEIASNIAAHFPHAKILFSLRNPIDRAYSAYLHRARNRKLDRSFEACFHEGHEVFEASRYYEKVKPYFDHFPKENIQVLLYEELSADPHAFLSRLLAFLGVGPMSLEDVGRGRANPTVAPRNRRLYRATMGTVRALRRRHHPWLDRAIEGVKKTGIKRLLVRREPQGDMSPDFRAQLAEYYRADIDKLEPLLELDLSVWRTG